jgi:hypothetical protein
MPTRREEVAGVEKTFNLMQQEPYVDQFYLVEPSVPVTERIEWPAEDCGVRRRDPQETKKGAPKLTTDPSQSSSCC